MVDTISVAFIVDESFVMPLEVAIRSLLNHLSPGHDLEIFVLGLDLSEQAKSAIHNTAEMTSNEQARTTRIRISIIPCNESSAFVAKMKLPELLPSSVSLVLYLDADILVRADISLLWQLKKNTRSLAAVVDVGVARPEYFNAGVMMMNLAHMRENKLTEKMMQILDNHPDFHGLSLKEQDIFNQVFTKWDKVSYSWNAQGLGSYANFRVTKDSAQRMEAQENCLFTPAELKDLEHNACIVHFTGSSKVCLSHFNPHCPEPVKPWSGLVTSPATKGTYPYAKEWFEVLYSIPTHRGWLPSYDRLKESLTEELEMKLNAIKENLDQMKKVVQDDTQGRHKARTHL